MATAVQPKGEENTSGAGDDPLVIVIQDAGGEGLYDKLFKEALTITSFHQSVHWIRASPPRRLPLLHSNFAKPNWLDRIYFRYGHDNVQQLVKAISSDRLFDYHIAPYTLIVELQDIVPSMSVLECAALMALLSNAASWIMERRIATARKQGSVYDSGDRLLLPPLLAVFRNAPRVTMIASLYTDHIIHWSADNVPTDL